MNLFKRAKELFVVEVDKSLGRLKEMTPELRDSIISLQHHPGFQYLLQKLEIEKATAEKYLREGFNLPESNLRHLQASVYYLGWLEAELKKALSFPTRVAEKARDIEQEEFERVRANLDLIGA